MEGLLHKDRNHIFRSCYDNCFRLVYMIHMAMNMTGTGMNMTKPCLMYWGIGDIIHLFVMWTIMMAAMMLPLPHP